MKSLKWKPRAHLGSLVVALQQSLESQRLDREFSASVEGDAPYITEAPVSDWDRRFLTAIQY